MELRIKEQSWIAKLAAKKLGTKSVAIVIGGTIHLHNVTKQQFLQNERWVKHEVCHLKQFQKHGSSAFVVKYLWESFRHGYYENKYEKEARIAEEE
ncbi:MAG: DUF4157 domain-containing protein [Ginsengibacter sp.]